MFLVRSHPIWLAGTALIGALLSIGWAADSPQQNEPQVEIVPRQHVKPTGARAPGNLKLDVKVVLIPVTVTDALGGLINNLRKDDFRIFEDDVEQKVSYVSTEEAPVSLGVMFDSSGSMSNRMTTSVSAMEEFFKTTLPGDEYLLVRFSDKPELITGFTSDLKELSGHLHSFRAGGWTAMYDAIYLTIQRMKKGRNGRKAILILSDGGDNNSHYTATETIRLARESDVRIFSISLLHQSPFLEQIAGETGGSTVLVHKMSELPDGMERMSRDLRSQYILGYHSSNSQNDGRYRKVKVVVNQPMAHASWRRGYYAAE
jgi:VWFA-related protein